MTALPSPGSTLAPGLRNYRVEYTPGPPAIGALTETVVRAWDANHAAEKVKAFHDWVMIHSVTEIS